MELKMTFTDWLKYTRTNGSPQMRKEKKEVVDYLLYEFVNWFEEESSEEINDISTLKFSQLFFLVCTIGLDKDSKESLIDDLFTELWAEPYGVVDREVKSYIKYCGKINNRTTTIDDDYTPFCKDRRVKEALRALKKMNKDLITYNSWDLMMIVHSRYSWAQTMYIAKKLGKFSDTIPKDWIKTDYKTYYKLK